MSRSGFSAVHLIFLLCLTILAWLFWELPALLPVRIIADLFYDLGRAVAGLLSGGHIKSVSAGLETGFSIEVNGGAPGLAVFAGYAGAMLFGGLLFLAASIFRFDKFITMLIGAGLVVLSLVFAAVGSAMIYAVIFGVVLFLVGFLLPRFLNDLVLKFMGMLGLFYVFFDLRGDLVFPSNHISDVTRMGSRWFGTPLLWAVIWGAAALILFLFLSRFLLHSGTARRRRGSSRREY